MAARLVDSHAHLSHQDFDSDRNEIISRAKSQGICLILSIGTEPEEFQKELSIAREHKGFIYLGMGYHPHIAKCIDDSHYEILCQTLGENKNIIALGEIGLDFYYKFSDPKSQEGVFREQLRIAAKLSLPVIIHCRDAYSQMIEILQREQVAPERALIHCFSGNREQAEKLIKWGATLSFAGPVTYPKAEGLRSVVHDTPLESLLVETDAPYLSPQGHRGKRNEPAYIQETYMKIAEIKKIGLQELAKQVSCNFARFFNLENQPGTLA